MSRIGASAVLSSALLLVAFVWSGTTLLKGQPKPSAIEVGSSHVKAGRPAEAVTLLEEYLAQRPGDERARIVLALAFLQSGAIDAAVRESGRLPAITTPNAPRQQLQRLIASVQKQAAARGAILQALVQFEPSHALQLVDRYGASFEDPELIKAYIHSLRARFAEATAAANPRDGPGAERRSTVLEIIKQRQADAEKEETRHFGIRWATESSQPAKTKDPSLQPLHELGFNTVRRDPSAGCYGAKSALEAQQLCRALLQLMHASRDATQGLTPLSLGSVDDMISDAIFYGTFDQAQRAAAISAREYGLIEIETEHRPEGGVSFGMLTIDTENRLIWYETLLDIHGVNHPAVGLPVFSIPFDQVRRVESDVEFAELNIGYRTFRNGGMALDFGEGRRVSVPLGMEAFGLAFSEAAARRALRNFQRLVASVAGIDQAHVKLVAEALSTSATFNSFAEISAGAAPMRLATSQTALAAFWRAQIARLMDAPMEAGGVDVAREAGRLGMDDMLFKLVFDSPTQTAEVNALLDALNASR